MASDLEQKMSEILDSSKESDNIPQEKEPAVEAEVENKEEGVKDTAESKEETQSSNTEGETPSDDLEEELKNIDPELKEAILNAAPELRESQIKVFKKMRASIDRKHTELGETKKLAETTKELFKQYGLDERRGFDQIRNLIEFEKNLKKNPKEVVKSLQELFKIKEESGSGQDIDLDSLTENERILYNKIIKAEEEAKAAKQEAENFKKLSQKEQDETILNEINSFREAVDENGDPKNPFFDDLLPEMEKLSTLYPKDNVEKLYHKAIKLNDEIASKIEEKKRKSNNLLTKRQEEALLKAKSINSQSLKSKTSSVSKLKSLDERLYDILATAT